MAEDLITKTRVTLAEAARLLGCSKSTARRKLKRLATFRGAPRGALEIKVSDLLHIIARERGSELPMLPELLAIREEMESMTGALVRVAKGITKVGSKLGVKV